MASRQIRQRKHTAATVITIIELVAILGLYLTVGIRAGLSFARQKGWIPERPSVSVEASAPTPTPEPSAQPEEEVLVVPEVTPEPAYCPSCGAVLADPAAQFCAACGVDLWNYGVQEEPLEPLTLSVMDATTIDVMIASGDIDVLPVFNTWESSIVTQSGTHDNSAYAVVDGNTDTSWQEGVDGDGLGEYITLDLGEEMQVQFLEAWLGNWRSDDWYNRNNVPAELYIQFYDNAGGYVDDTLCFPKEKKKFGIELSRPVTARYVRIEIVDVYPGSKYDDTCIAEIRVCGYEE